MELTIRLVITAVIAGMIIYMFRQLSPALVDMLNRQNQVCPDCGRSTEEEKIHLVFINDQLVECFKHYEMADELRAINKKEYPNQRVWITSRRVVQ
jgi:hypothetical protein